MNIIKDLYKVILLALFFTPAVSSCSTDEEEMTSPVTEDADVIRFDVPSRTICGTTQTRVAQDGNKTGWEKGDVIYVCAYFFKEGDNAGASQFSALKCVDPDTNDWRYLTDSEFENQWDDNNGNVGDGEFRYYQMPLRWPIGSASANFIVTYAGGKVDGSGTKIEYSSGSWTPFAKIGTDALVGRVDLLRTEIGEVKDKTKDIPLSSFKHLLTRLNVKGGGTIRPYEVEGDKSRIAIAVDLNLFSGMVNNALEAGKYIKPGIADGEDYYVMASYSTNTGGGYFRTADDKADYVSSGKDVRVVIQPEGGKEATYTLVRPKDDKGGLTSYAGSFYTIGEN